MATIYEVGHAKNVANFEEILSFCISYQSDYNPTKASIQVPALQKLLNDSRIALANVIEKVSAFNNATNKRREIFATLKPLSTKLINALSATDASEKTISDAKSINRKIQGARSTRKKTVDIDPNNMGTPDEKTISSSQQSYDQLTEHYAKLISLLQLEASYNPNEKALQIATLNAHLAEMRSVRTNLINAYTDLSNSRLMRNELLYKPSIGLSDVCQEIKKYIKSVFGATSPQYKQISGIRIASK